MAKETESNVVKVETLAPKSKTLRQLYKQFVDEGKEFIPCKIQCVRGDEMSGKDGSIRPIAFVTLEETGDTTLIRDQNIMSLITLQMIAQTNPNLAQIADFLNRKPEAGFVLLAGATADAVQIAHKAFEPTVDLLSGNEFVPEKDGHSLYLFNLKLSEASIRRIEKIIDKELGILE